MNNELISIIVPIYNAEKHLRQCIDSIINQEYKNIEILLIDDGSTDSSSVICDEYAKEDTRIKVVHKNNEGVSAARNYGIKISLGKWITFVDSDDYITADYIKSLYNYVTYDVDLVIGRTIAFDGITTFDDYYCGDSVEYFKTAEEKKKLITSIFDDYSKNMKYPHISTCSAKLFRKSIINEKNLIYIRELKYYEDGLFNIDFIFNCNKIVIMDKIIYYYRMHFANATKLFNNGTFSYYEKSYEEFQKRFMLYNIDHNTFWDIFIIKNINTIITNIMNAKLVRKEKKILIRELIIKYKESINKVSLKRLPKKRKMLVILARCKMYNLIYQLYKI